MIPVFRHSAAEMDDYRVFVKKRILDLKRLAEVYHWAYHIERVLLIVASVSLPFVTEVVSGVPQHKWVITSLAVLVALLAAMDSLFRPGEMWRHFRSYELALSRLLRLYDLACRKATTRGELAADELERLEAEFVRSAEQLMSEEAAKFFEQKQKELLPAVGKTEQKCDR